MIDTMEDVEQDLVLTLPVVKEFLDFERFGIQIALVSLLVRLQVVLQVTRDSEFAEKVFKAYSATRKLAVIEKLIEAESLEVG